MKWAFLSTEEYMYWKLNLLNENDQNSGRRERSKENDYARPTRRLSYDFGFHVHSFMPQFIEK